MHLYKRKGSPHWYLSYAENGIRKQKTLHKYLGLRFPVKDRSEAQDLLAKLRLKELHDHLEIPDDFGSLSVHEFHLRYFRFCDQNKARSTARTDKERLSRWLRFLKKERMTKIAQVSLKTFRTFTEEELKGLGNATKNRYTSIVKASLNWGIREGYLKRNPLENVIRLKELRSVRSASFNPEDLEKLFSIDDKIFLVFLKLIRYTLVRRSEALALTWRDVDFKQRTIFVKRKTGLLQHIPLNDGAIIALRTLSGPKNDSQRIFPFGDNQVTKKFQRLKERMKLNIRGLHDFRHLVASELLRKGTNPKTVQELLGHSSIRTTMEIYAHVSLDDLREAVTKL